MGGLQKGLASLFGSDFPQWACEFRSDAVTVVEASSDLRMVRSRATVSVPDGAIVPGIKEKNIVDPAQVESALGRALDEAGFTGSEIIVVIPDDAVRISVLDTEAFPSAKAEQESFIRWKLKKSVQFDASTANVAYEVLEGDGARDLLTALSPDRVVGQYEAVVDGLGLHPGVVSPSSTAAMNLLDAGASTTDFLFVKVSRTSVVTAIFSKQKLRFYRKLPWRDSLDEAVYPTLMYYEDKLSGAADGPERRAIEEAVFCSEVPDVDAPAAAAKLGLRFRPLYSADLEDIYKPALGALQR